MLKTWEYIYSLMDVAYIYIYIHIQRVGTLLRKKFVAMINFNNVMSYIYNLYSHICKP